MNWPESKYLPCNNCLEDTEHNTNIYDQFECVICCDTYEGDE